MNKWVSVARLDTQAFYKNVWLLLLLGMLELLTLLYLAFNFSYVHTAKKSSKKKKKIQSECPYKDSLCGRIYEKQNLQTKIKI